MKALVTGGCGFIGYNMVKLLLDRGWSVCVLDDFSSGKRWNKLKGVEYVDTAVEIRATELSNVNGVDTAVDAFTYFWRPNVIFHFAAVPRVSYSVEQPYKTTGSNVMGTLAVLDAARKFGARVVYSSSSSVYGGADALPTPVDSPPNPQSPYAMQKWQGEEWCRLYANLYDLDVVSLRYFNVFGPHSYYGGAYSTVLSAWLYNLYVRNDVSPFLEDDGEQSRDFCYVDNVCEANLLAASHQSKFCGESFNVAQGSAHTLLDCKALLEDISGKTLDLEMRPPRSGDVRHTLADISLTRSVLGYDPGVDFEAQVRKMADWYESSYRDD